MKTIRIKGIRLENYKCFDAYETKFDGNNIEICGRNGKGKTTLKDAFLDIMTGKLSDGTVPDKIRRKKNGVEVDRVDIVRSLDLEIYGKNVEISKITKQKWRKPKGQTEEVLDGNETVYSVDGFDTKPKAFAEYIDKIAPADILYLCSNPNAFLSVLNKSTAEARKILEKLAGFDLESFISSNPDYSEVFDITKGHSIEDTLKQLRKNLISQKKKIEAKITEIKYEKNRDNGKPTIEISDLELAKAAQNERILEFDKQDAALDETAKVFDELSAGIMELKFSLSDIERRANEGNNTIKQALNDEIFELSMQKKSVENDLREAEMGLKHSNMMIERYTADMKKAQEDWKKYSAREYPEENLDAIKAEQFDESSLICPTCGQTFPSEQADKIRADFETKKANRINNEEEIRGVFYKEKDKKLAEITDDGNAAAAGLEAARKSKGEAENKISECKNKLAGIASQTVQKQSELDKLPRSIDMSNNMEYQTIKAEIFEKEKALDGLNSITVQRQKIRQMRNQCIAEIQKIEREIGKAIAADEEKDKKIAKLEAELKELSQAEADIQRRIDVVSAFSRDKNAALADMINPYLKHSRFVFLDTTFEGNDYETCRLMGESENGYIDYMNGLNHGARIRTDYDLLQAFQKMSGLNMPIFLDDVESLDENKIPHGEQQLIVLRRTDGKELEIKEI